MTAALRTPGTGRRSASVRVGLVVLALTQVTVGVWALLAPWAFFDGFPAAGHAWVASLPPFNEHLVRDVGGLSLAVSVVLGAAAVWPETRLVRVALIAFLAQAIPHTAFHTTHLDGLATTDAVAQTSGFVIQIGLAVVLLALTVAPKANRTGRR